MIAFLAGLVIGIPIGVLAIAFMIGAHMDDYDDRPTGTWRGPWQ